MLLALTQIPKQHDIHATATPLKSIDDLPVLAAVAAAEADSISPTDVVGVSATAVETVVAVSTADAKPAGNDASRHQLGPLLARIQELQTQIDHLRDSNVLRVSLDPTICIDAIVDGSSAAVLVQIDPSRAIWYHSVRDVFGYRGQQYEFESGQHSTVDDVSTVMLPVVPCDKVGASVIAHVACTVLHRGLVLGSRCVALLLIVSLSLSVCVCVCV